MIIDVFSHILYICVLKFKFYTPVRIMEEIIFSIQTLTVQVEVPSLETSKFSLSFSGSCIPINPKLSYIFPSEFLVVFNRFQCKKYHIFDEKFIYFVYSCNNCRVCVELTLEIHAHPYCERACSGERDCSSPCMFRLLYRYQSAAFKF